MSIVSIETPSTTDGGDSSDGWHLLKSDDLSVIEELVPPGEKERRHYHQTAQQFFYVLSGQAVIEISGKQFAPRVPDAKTATWLQHRCYKR